MCWEINHRDVTHCKIYIGICRPAAGLVEIRYFQFIHPDSTVFDTVWPVANTYKHNPNIAQTRIAKHSHCILHVVGIVTGIKHSVSHPVHICALIAVSWSLQGSKHIQWNVQIVCQRPDSGSVSWIEIVIIARRGQFQWNLILIIIILDIWPQANEYRKVSIAQRCNVVNKSLGMHPHLKTLVYPHVKLRVFIYTACVSGLQSFDCNRKRLFI